MKTRNEKILNDFLQADEAVDAEVSNKTVYLSKEDVLTLMNRKNRMDIGFIDNEIQNLESDVIATAITYRDNCDYMVKELKEVIELHKTCLKEGEK